MSASRRVRGPLSRIILCTILIVVGASSAAGQRAVFQAPDGATRVPGRGPRVNPNASPQQVDKPDAGKKPNEGEEKKEGDKEKSDEEKKDEEQTSLKRPKSPPRVPDPREFDVLPDENDRLRFSFNGQMWPDVLQWVASLGNHSLDWQELPDDYINFTANRDYSLEEVRDLFNRLLFERGYTMILQGEVLLVLKISKLDPSLLPRVEDESQLMDRKPHDFVKITLQLPTQLKADKAAEDVKPLLSSHAKVQPLMATNRLLVVDIVANLREVSRLVNTEHAAATGNIVPREFPIRFARASHIADQVMILLGLDPASRRTPQELQVEQQKIQLFTQMQQKGKDVTKYLRPGSAPRVYLAVNERNNTVLANAPPEEMKVITRSIELLDTPSGTLAGAMPTTLTMEKYQLITLKPESVVTALEDIAEIDPRTRLKIDSDAKTVFAYATARDHDKIRKMIDDLDGTGRELEVVWLRRLPADAVATTIQNLMVGQEEEENERPYYWGWRSRDREEDPPNKGFRVDADIENNRLLLWANENELKEVRKFLAKLGEIPGDSGNPNTVRVLDPRDPNATLKLLEQLRLMWPTVGPNELRIEGTLPKPRPESQPPADATDETDDQDEPRPDRVLDTSVMRTPDSASQHGSQIQIAWLTDDVSSAQANATDPEQAGPKSKDAIDPPAAPPVVITVDETGRIIISSRDTKALDRLEDLVTRIAPHQKDYEVFYLQNAMASLVTLNLREYFEEENSEDDFWRGWYGFDFQQDKGKGEGLSKRPKIRFIYDYDTNSILVANASPTQLATVRALVEIYDKPPSDDSISARRYQIFKLKHARAEEVAETIKDVYRDLLSSKDKVFDRNRGEKEQSSQTTNYYRVYGSSGDENKKPKKIRASFAGALSVGTDKVSNTVIVSAQEEWIPSISEMIEYLDVEAEPHKPTIEVVKTKINAEILQSALAGTFGQQGKASEPKKPPKEEKPPMSPEQAEERQRQAAAGR